MSYNLCCISKSLASEGHKFQTMTWARFSRLSREEAVETVSERTLNNIRVTHKILEQCASKGWGYRVSSALFPLLTYDVAELDLEEYPHYNFIMEALNDCAKVIRENRIRITCHPDQFNVLASLGKAQVEKTIKELTKKGINLLNAKVAILGLTFKENCPDLRNTKVLTIYKKLKQYNFKITISDEWGEKKEISSVFNIKPTE